MENMKILVVHKQALGISLLTFSITLFIIFRLDGLRFAVPNQIHFYRSWEECGNVSQVEVACLLNAVNFHPQVYIHGERPIELSRALSSAVGLWPKGIVIRPWPLPALMKSEDFSHRREPLFNALQILRTYGGIYLENDVFLLKSLDDFRYHETTVSLKGREIQTELLAANSGSKFITNWLSNYKTYKLGILGISSPSHKSIHAVKDAVIPMFKDVYFIPNNINPDKVYGVQIK